LLYQYRSTNTDACGAAAAEELNQIYSGGKLDDITGAQFTCFTSTKVRLPALLVQKAASWTTSQVLFLPALLVQKCKY
jgi:hypothetical protein